MAEIWLPFTDEEWVACELRWDAHADRGLTAEDAAAVMRNLDYERDRVRMLTDLVGRALENGRHDATCRAANQTYAPEEHGAFTQEHVDCTCWMGEAWDEVMLLRVVPNSPEGA